MPSHPVQILIYKSIIRKKTKFNGVYSKNILPKIKDGEYVINLDEYESVGTHQITLYVNTKNVTYFDSFEVENIPKKIRKFIANKNVITNSYRIQAYDSIMADTFVLYLLI